MRSLLWGDIIAAARALIAVPTNQRAKTLATMLVETEAAHRYHKRLSKPHPQWGNGSLQARANQQHPLPEPFASEIPYLQLLQLVIETIVAHKIDRRGG